MSEEDKLADDLHQALLKICRLPRPTIRKQILEAAKQWIEDRLNETTSP